jgi:hydroxymethylpyrimidine pyrophosphatase-like HAD family hydrolase
MRFVVASDLDGTLLTSEGTVTPRAVAVVADVRRAGGVFLAVTARPLRDALPIAAQLGATGLVCSGGAIVFDPGAGQVVSRTVFAAGDVARIVAAVRAGLPGVRIGVDYPDRCELDAGFRLGWYGPGDLVAAGPVAVAAEPAVKVIVQSDTVGPDALAVRLTELLGDMAVTVGVPSPRLADILPAGVDKAGHLTGLTAALAVPPPTVAFGDMPVDLPMLRWADAAVAVANAHPAVLAAATEVTAANDEDGVPVYLERMLRNL